MLNRLRPRSAYDVMAAVAFFIAIAGGGAYAAATIGSNAIKNDAVLTRHIKDGEVRRSDLAANSIATGKIADGQVFRSDLNPSARTRRVDFKGPNRPGVSGGIQLKLGDLQLETSCTSESGTTNAFLILTARNIGSKTAGIDAAYLKQSYDGAGPEAVTDGLAVGPGEAMLVNDEDSTYGSLLKADGLQKADGQLVLRTPGRVTTVTFHAGVVGGANGYCQLSGTAAFANS